MRTVAGQEGTAMGAMSIELNRLLAPARQSGSRRWSRPTDRALATAAVAGAALLWGTSFVAAKEALASFPPVTLALLRFVVALAILEPIVRQRGVRPVQGRQAILLGLTGVALPLTCQNVGLRFGDAANATLLYNGATPILAGLLAAVVLGERLAGLSLLGLMASSLGVASVVLVESAGVGFAARGDGLFLLGSASCAVYTVAARRAFTGGDLLATLTGITRCGVLLLLPVAVVELAAVGIGMPDARAVLLVLYLGAGCSALAYALAAFSARHLEAGPRSVILNVEVPVGAAAGAVLMGEPLVTGQVAGALLILFGAAMTVPLPLRVRRAAAPRLPVIAAESA